MSTTNGTLPISNSPPILDDPSENSLYGYVPTRWICLVFIVFFGLSTVIHIGQAIHSRRLVLFFTTVLAGIAELIGWGARLQSSSNPTAINPFLTQITTTIIAPTPLVAANFVILGEVIVRLGEQYSRLNVRWYTWIFLFCDIVSLAIQAVGGAQASSALQDNKDPNPGAHIMLCGIAFQLVAVCSYLILATDFLLRYVNDVPIRIAPRRRNNQYNAYVKLMIVGLALDGLFILIRSIYRTVELSDGWNGRIINTQVYFNVFDGAMIVLAMFTLNCFHPGVLLGKAPTWFSSSRFSSSRFSSSRFSSSRFSSSRFSSSVSISTLKGSQSDSDVYKVHLPRTTSYVTECEKTANV